MVLVRGCMRIEIPVSRKGADLPVDENASFPEFLKRVVPGSKTVPAFGIFENRIKEAGRPYVLLLFDATGRPAVVVKAGTSKEARRLIRAEQEFFFPKRPHFPSLPEALDRYEGEEASAIAYRYVEGAPPKPRQHGEIESLLNSWIRDDEVIRPVSYTHLRWKLTTPQWPIMHAVLEGISRDQMMARHKSNHIQVVYAPDKAAAKNGLFVKAAAMAELGLEVSICGNV